MGRTNNIEGLFILECFYFSFKFIGRCRENKEHVLGLTFIGRLLFMGRFAALPSA
jgi:hypothetical protein